MKKLKFTAILFAALVLALSACNKEQNNPSEGENVYLSAVSTAMQTRVSGDADNQWDGNEAIGLYATALNASNVKYTTTSTGSTAKFETTENIIIPSGATEYDVTAYYPYVEGSELTYDLASNSTQPILFAATKVKHSAPTAVLNFKHKLGKLIVKVVVESGEGVPVVTLKDASTKLTLDPVTGNLTAQETTADLQLNRIADTNVFYAFVMPEAGAKERTLSITHNGKSYSAKINHEIKAGVRKTWNVTLKDSAAQLNPGNETDIEGTTEEEEGNTDANQNGVSLDLTEFNVVDGVNILEVAKEATEKTVTLLNAEPATEVEVVISESDKSWLNIKGGQTGVTLRSTKKEVIFTLTENSGSERSSEVQLVVGDVTLKFTVKQAAGNTNPEEPQEIVITPSVSQVSISAAGVTNASFDVTVTPEGTDWSVNSDQNWLTVVKDGAKVTYTAQANDGVERTANIVITAGEKTATIVATQAAKPEEGDNALYPNGFGDSFTITGATSTVKGAITEGSGKNGGQAIAINGTTAKGNGISFTLKSPTNVTQQIKQIKFWIKGTSAKSISITQGTTAKPCLNLMDLSNTTINKSSSNSYTSKIDTKGEWVQVTLNIDGFLPNTFDTNYSMLVFRIGGEANYDLLVSDFEVFY